MPLLRLPRSLIPQASKILAKHLRPGDVVGLVGPLGAGKTTLVKQLARQLKIKKRVTSPTFTLLQSYSGWIKNIPIILHHADLYRLDTADEASQIGLHEALNQPDAITIIEWADKFPNLLPRHAILLVLDYT